MMFEQFQAAATDSAAQRGARLAPLRAAGASLSDRMKALIVRLQRDGRDVLAGDLEKEGFTAGEIEAHFPEASALADSELVRDVGAELAGYDREARILEAVDLIQSMLPATGNVRAALAADDRFSPAEIEALWPEIIARAADRFDDELAGSAGVRARQ